MLVYSYLSQLSLTLVRCGRAFALLCTGLILSCSANPAGQSTDAPDAGRGQVTSQPDDKSPQTSIKEPAVCDADRYYTFSVEAQSLNWFPYYAHVWDKHCPPPSLNLGCGQAAFDKQIDNYDTLLFASTLQGLVNRHGAHLYLHHHAVDKTWESELKSEQIALHDRQAQPIADMDGLLKTFKRWANPRIEGSVVWDAAKPYTLPIAITLAGAHNLVVLRANSALLDKVSAVFPVKMDLRHQPFASKQQAYAWLRTSYLDTGKAGPTLAYLTDGAHTAEHLRGRMFPGDEVDAWTTSLVDLAVAKNVVAYDLSPDSRMPPAADAAQFEALLKSARRRVPADEMLEVWGLPTNRKYRGDCDGNGTIDESDFVQCLEWTAVQRYSENGAALRRGMNQFYGEGIANASFLSAPLGR